MIWKALFGAVGLGSLAIIFHSYGLEKLAQDVLGLGWWSIPLALSFIPVAFCYGLAWLLMLPELPLSRAFLFCRLSLVSVAWNNLSPFVKVLGEPMRVMLIEPLVSRKIAIRSVVLYNLVHTLGTIAALLLGALITLFYFPVSPDLRIGFLAVVALLGALFVALYFLPGYRGRGRKSGRAAWLLRLRFWLRWSFSKIRVFSRLYPTRFWLAVFCETIARFVEGLTFYLAFLALREPLPFLHCSLLDIGRALMDTVFFFIPYQVGSREAGMVLFTHHVLHEGERSAVGAAVIYRLVEVLWILLGYLLWIYESRSARSSK